MAEHYDASASKRERVKAALETILAYAVAESDAVAYPDDIDLVIAAVERHEAVDG